MSKAKEKKVLEDTSEVTIQGVPEDYELDEGTTPEEIEMPEVDSAAEIEEFDAKVATCLTEMLRELMNPANITKFTPDVIEAYIAEHVNDLVAIVLKSPTLINTILINRGFNMLNDEFNTMADEPLKKRIMYSAFMDIIGTFIISAIHQQSQQIKMKAEQIMKDKAMESMDTASAPVTIDAEVTPKEKSGDTKSNVVELKGDLKIKTAIKPTK